MRVPAPEGSLLRDWAKSYVRVRQLVRTVGRVFIDWSYGR